MAEGVEVTPRNDVQPLRIGWGGTAQILELRGAVRRIGVVNSDSLRKKRRKIPVAESGLGDSSKALVDPPQPVTLIVQESESLVLPDRPAQSEAELVLFQGSLSGIDRVAEEIRRVERIVPEELEQAPVKFVAPPLGLNGNDAPRRMPILRGESRREHLELAHGVEVRPHVDVRFSNGRHFNSIQGHGIRLGPHPVDRERHVRRRAPLVIGGVLHTVAQEQERKEVSAVERQSLDLLLLDDLIDVGLVRLQQRRTHALNLNRLAHLSDGKNEIGT